MSDELRLPNEHDPLTPDEVRDLGRQMMSDYTTGGLRARELMKCEMENMYRLLRTVNHLQDVIYAAYASLDNGNYRGARSVLQKARTGEDLPKRVKREGIGYVSE